MAVILSMLLSEQHHVVGGVRVTQLHWTSTLTHPG